MSKPRILIVEDDNQLADYLKEILSEFNYEIAGVTSSGEEAIQMARNLVPDLVLMDILLAGNTDGVAAAQEIFTNHQIPVVFLTAYMDEQTLQRVLYSRPYGYLLKPFKANELHAAIQVALNRFQSERKQENERPFVALLEGLPYAAIACDESGLVRFLNQAARNLTGWTQEESTHKKFEQVFHIITPAPADADDSVIQHAAQNEATLFTRSGVRIPIDYQSSVAEIGRKKWFITIFRNIGESKRLEEALNESRMKYKGLVNSIDGIVWEVDGRTGEYVFISRKADKLIGYSAAMWASDPNFWKEHIFPPDRTAAINARAAGISLKKDYESEYRMIAANGRILWVRDIVTLFPEDATSVRLVGVTIDITQRRKAEEEIQKAKEELEIRVGERTAELTKAYQKLVFELAERQRAEEALRRSEAKYRVLFEESQDMIFISTPQGKFLDINPAGLRLLGYESKEELQKIEIQKQTYATPEDRRDFIRLMEEQGFVKDLEIKVKTKQGKILTVLETSAAVKNERGQIVAYRGIIRDYTKLKELEEALRQAQKMEAIGHLAGGLAHDFNNLLMAIMGYCELLQIKLPRESSLLNDLAEIQKAAEAGGALIRQLLAFSRKQILEMHILDLNALILDTEKLLQRLVGDDIQLVIEFEGQLGRIKADPVQIEQVLFNLAANARDAMPHGGILKISTANRTETSVEIPEPPPGEYVVLSVRDNGTGMDEQTLSHVFEPFFTTKEKGKGTGMGLATVYGIVTQSGGYVFVDSKVGSGASFRIYFPRTDRAIENEEPVKATDDKIVDGKTILLVDDNELARKPFALQLEMQGFAVLEANSGEQALEISHGHKGVIDLLITDMVMPGIGGRDLCRAIRERRPDVKTLFISGYFEEEEGEKFEAGTAFLAKPATREALMQKIRELL